MGDNANLYYKDSCVSVFYDNDKNLLVYVNSKGNTQVVDYADNFYSKYDDLRAYTKLLLDDFDNDKEEARPFFDRFVEFIENDFGEEVDKDIKQNLWLSY